MFSGRENRYLESWNTFSQGVITAATAAQTNGVQLRNPPASNVIAVVEKLLIAAGAAMTITLSNGSGADLTVALNGNPYDGRTGVSSTCVMSSSVASPAVLGAALGPISAQANVNLDVIVTDIQELVITPGTTLRLTGGTVNTSLAVFWIWRERFLEESERT
jgi:hypothetical protein